ncbi:3-deoxy-D-manno-octulosonic acid transferase [candidate division KSB1 bacterium]
MVHYFSFLIYAWLLFPLSFITVQIWSLFNEKIRRGLGGRKELFNQLKEFRSTNSGKVILFHCVSYGEVLQAKPIAQRIKEKHPDIKTVVSFISPSGYDNLKESAEFDFKTYLPIDKYSYAYRFFSILRPHLWIIVKHDIWPNHVKACSDLNIPIILIDANLPHTSRRLKPIAASFYKSFYRDFKLVLPVSDDDAERFLKVFPYRDRIVTAGDTRYDQVYSSAQIAKDKEVQKLPFFQDKKVFIGGSVWKEDLQHILPALPRIMDKDKSLFLILVPHEIDNEQMSFLEMELKQLNLPFCKYNEIEEIPTERILIIDCIGLLAATYKYGYIAYVGGSFSTGVHNVMEPAIFRSPVLFGPRYTNSFEAIEMVKRGGGFSITNSDDFYKYASDLINDPQKRDKAGETAETVVLENLGASERITVHIEKYL